jgi:hypothetical protein
MNTTTALSLSSLGLASLSLSWQFYYAVRVDRARLRAKVDTRQIVPAGIAVLAITVTNVGRRATVLQSAHLTLGKPHPIRDRLRPKKWRPTYNLMPFADTDLGISTQLPKRLEPGDEANFYIRRHHVDKNLQELYEKWVHVRAHASTARSRVSRRLKVLPAETQ